MLNNFAPLYVKPIHFNLGFSGTLRSLFVIFLRGCFLSPIFVHFISGFQQRPQQGFQQRPQQGFQQERPSFGQQGPRFGQQGPGPNFSQQGSGPRGPGPNFGQQGFQQRPQFPQQHAQNNRHGKRIYFKLYLPVLNPW